MASRSFDLVYFSTTAFGVTILGPYWQARFGVPYVLDLQDPWLSDYYDRPGAPAPPGGRFKYAISRTLARVLEPIVMRRVSHVISVSPAYPHTLMNRYPWMSPEQFTVLPFGAPEGDFELLKSKPVSQSVFDPSDGLEHWVYVGVMGEIMRLSLKALFTALRRARDDHPDRVGRFRLHFVGTSYATGNQVRKTVEPLASECGVADLVEERPGRIPYFEALQCLIDADALIMLGSDDPGYTASKLYPYILARRPLLAVFHEQSSVVDILRRTKAGTVVTFAQGEGSERIADRIGEAWFKRAELPSPETEWRAFEPYTAREIARQQCDVFERVVGITRETS